MRDHVAKVLCDAAGRAINGTHCPSCELLPTGVRVCTMWKSFLSEAEAVIGAVRDYARIDRRNSPKSSYSFTADRWV